MFPFCLCASFCTHYHSIMQTLKEDLNGGADGDVEICLDHELHLCVCLGTFRLNCGRLSDARATSAPETHTPWTESPPWHSLIPPFEPYWILRYGVHPAAPTFESVSRDVVNTRLKSPVSCLWGWFAGCVRRLITHNPLVKHGMWINVPCISAHLLLIGKGCGFESSAEEFEDMA